MNNEDKINQHVENNQKPDLFTRLMKALKFPSEYTKNSREEVEATFDGAGIYLDFTPPDDPGFVGDEGDKG
tara:strand:- start:211 stop:423 length:213 start_codon:yes stop_codon:yes gene_type:complete